MLKLGDIFVTIGVKSIIDNNPLFRITIEICLELYERCNWGDTCKEDQKLNNRALIDNTRILAVYKIDENLKIWIITEHDRSYTTILLPEEY